MSEKTISTHLPQRYKIQVGSGAQKKTSEVASEVEKQAQKAVKKLKETKKTVDAIAGRVLFKIANLL